MKAVVKTSSAPGALELQDLPEPEPRDGHLLVRVLASGICGTDVHIYHWNERAARSYKPPGVLGHELCGEVLWAPPGDHGFQVGDLIALETHLACGRCYQCLRGEAHVCADARTYSAAGYSGMAERTLVPFVAARRIPPEMGVDIGTLLGPLGVSVHAMEVAQPAGAFVGVIGCGPIGLFAIATARAMGARAIFATETAPLRRRLAEGVGAVRVSDPRETPASKLFLEATGGRGVDVLVEASGHGDALVDGMQGLRRGGVGVLVGVPSGAVPLEIGSQVVTRGITLHGIAARRIDRTWQTMEGLLASGVLDVSKVITHRFPLARFQEAFDAASQGEAGKVLLIP